MSIEINWFAVLVAVIASMVVGFLWYSPFVLGKPWMKERGFTPQDLKAKQKETGKWYAASLFPAFLTAFVLAHVMALSMNFYHYPSVQTGLTTATFMWLGFVMPTQATATMFSDKRNWKLFGIDTGFQLASLVVMGIILGMFS